MRDQRRAPCLARFGVAQGVELQRHAVGDAEFVEQLIGERQQFDVGGGFGGADDLRIELMELPEAALLRALVAEDGAARDELERRVLLPAVGDVGARDRSEEHTSELQSLMRISYAVFCLKKKTKHKHHTQR